MKFRAELRNIRTFSKLIAALHSLEKIVWLRLEDDLVRFIVIPDRGSQVWATFHKSFLFDEYMIQSLEENNAINIELTLAALQRALKSALNSTDAVLRLTKRDGAPVLSMTIQTMTNPRAGGLGGFGGGGGGGGGGGSSSMMAASGASGRRTGWGASGHQQQHREGSTFGDAYGGASSSLAHADGALEVTVKREREKTVIQDMPVRIMAAEAMESAQEPPVREADVNIVLPPLLQLKAVSDRFTKLAHTTSGGGSSGSLLSVGGGVSGGLGLGLGLGLGTGGSATSPKLELSANMYGMLRLRLVTDTLSVETVWNDLENPALNEEALPVPLAEHPSTRFREAGPERVATVRVDGRDWSRVLSVGRLDGRVIASFIDGTSLNLHVYVAHPDDPDDGGETGMMTYYVTSYSV